MRSRLATVVLVAVIGGASLSACGNSQASLQGKQACADVTQSISLYNKSVHTTDPAAAKVLAKQATNELRLALPLAAAADANDGTWQPLEATLSESNRFGVGTSLNEGNLTAALSAQCTADLGS
jgi:hypothetical protein